MSLHHTLTMAPQQLAVAVYDIAATSLPSAALVLAAALSIFAAALVRGFTGFGFALTAVPLLGLFMPPTQSVPVAVCLQLLIGLGDLPRASRVCDWPSLRWLILGGVIGSPIGVLVLSLVSASAARLLIALITVGAVVLLNAGFRLTTAPARRITALVGLTAGMFNGLAGMPGPPVIVYYNSGAFGRIAARASMMVFFLVSSIVATATLASFDLLDLHVAVLTALGIPVMLVGTWLGDLGFHRGSDTLHRRVSMTSLAAVALGSALKGLSDLL
ncbi:sulfite exporter TauE/SafE family protein [Bradyrhizobium oligotrophicum]|uniref:sulfite exporter TauE/SafE family protein n=1 Tax=Bradyrhizobium oligotrophicum TaxID=44255 RepID=UPI003672E5A4